MATSRVISYCHRIRIKSILQCTDHKSNIAKASNCVEFLPWHHCHHHRSLLQKISFFFTVILSFELFYHKDQMKILQIKQYYTSMLMTNCQFMQQSEKMFNCSSDPFANQLRYVSLDFSLKKRRFEGSNSI